MQINKSSLEHSEFFRDGMGTEGVAPFLRSLIGLVKPKRILEIGIGYTTPFLIDGINNNSKNFIEEINMNKSYYESGNHNEPAKLIIIDDNSLDNQINEKVSSKLKKCNFLEYIEGKFQGKGKYLFEKYGFFDFVWFDCGGKKEYSEFIREYWRYCNDYVIFHFTYTDGSPNSLMYTLHKELAIVDKNKIHRIDIVEPHKRRQGSITMLRKAPLPVLEKVKS